MPADHITQEQADEYAIGALEAPLERAIALHLAECDSCRDIVHDSERLASKLSLSAPRRKAPRQLRNRVWTAAGIRRPSPLQRVMRLGPVAAAIAAIVVAIGAFTGMVSVRNEINALKADNGNFKTEIDDALSQKVEIAAATERLAQAEAATFQLQQSTRSDRELMLAMMSPESEAANLLATEGHDPAIGRLIWDEKQKKVWFVATRLPPRPRGETYHIWVNSSGKFISLGTFNTDETGFARFEKTIPEGIAQYDQAVVTIESVAAEARDGDAVFVAYLSGLEK